MNTDSTYFTAVTVQVELSDHQDRLMETAAHFEATLFSLKTCADGICTAAEPIILPYWDARMQQTVAWRLHKLVCASTKQEQTICNQCTTLKKKAYI